MTYTVQDSLVWCEIPVTNMDAGTAFYEALFNCEMKRDNMGPNEVAWFPKQNEDDAAGHLYPGKPAENGNGPTVHLHAPDTLEATVERIRKAGAEVIGPVIPLPVGRFQYAVDPFGNSIGIFSKAS